MWCNDYIKIPFTDKGRDRQGCDCWGLARLIYKEKLGIDLPALLNYDSTKDSQSISDLYEGERFNWQEIERGNEEPFDLLVFKILGFPTHIATVVQKGLMIHCEKGCGTHVSDYNREKQWCTRLVGVYRYVDSSKISDAFSA